jgi:hypothetical protein
MAHSILNVLKKLLKHPNNAPFKHYLGVLPLCDREQAFTSIPRFPVGFTFQSLTL